MAEVKEESEVKSQADRVAETLARIDAMQANFESTKEEFAKSIFKINKQIEKAAKLIYKTNKFKLNNKITNVRVYHVLCWLYRAEAKAAKRSIDKLGTARHEADCEEFFDDEKSLQIKIKKLAELVRKSNHFVAFTGAGIPFFEYSSFIYS